MRMRLTLCVAVALVVFSACNGSDSPTTERPAAAPDDPRYREFVVFTQEALDVHQIGAPVPVPATVGSTPSQVTLRSDAPETVSISQTGEIVPLRPGLATVRAVGTGQTLTVRVHEPANLVLSPTDIRAVAGRASVLDVIARRGAVLVQPNDVQWRTSDPLIAVAVNGKVEVTGHAGRATITAFHGRDSAQMIVVVKPESTP